MAQQYLPEPETEKEHGPNNRSQAQGIQRLKESEEEPIGRGGVKI